jgi:hypothetical protein
MRCYRCEYPFFSLARRCPRCTARRRHYYLIVSLLVALLFSFGILVLLDSL